MNMFNMINKTEVITNGMEELLNRANILLEESKEVIIKYGKVLYSKQEQTSIPDS